jgi:2-dehydropantoate 2-reductase
MQIVVVGAGTLGTFVATELERERERTGEEITLYLRESEIPTTGSLYLSIRNTNGKEIGWAIVPVTSNMPENPDAILLATKAQDLAKLSPIFEKYPDATYVTLQGIPDVERLLPPKIPLNQIIGICPLTGISTIEPYEPYVTKQMNSEPFIAGYLSPEPNESTRKVMEILTKGLNVQLKTDVNTWRWKKLFLNIATPLSALTNTAIATLLEDNHLFPIYRSLLRESSEALAALQIPLEPEKDKDTDLKKFKSIHTIPGIIIPRITHAAREFPLPTEPSPLTQHLRRGHYTEIDATYGYLVALANQKGLTMPIMTKLVGLVHEVEKSQQIFTADRLAKALK